MPKTYSPKILLIDNLTNVPKDDVDIWITLFLELVWPTLPNKKEWFLLINSKRPVTFESKSLPKGLKYHFHGDDHDITEDWLSRADVIHCLYNQYNKSEHIWHWEDKFGTVFVHSYPRDVFKCIETEPELQLLQMHDAINVQWADDFLATFRRRIWTGCNKTTLYDEHPNYTYNVPNLYEFKSNAGLTNHIENKKIGYATKISTTKAFHWLHGQIATALIDQHDLKRLRAETTFTMPELDIYQWEPESLIHFMNKNWGIYHGAHFGEPFGYDIFQAVDFGKLPILNYDWCTELDYKYRVGTKNEFDKMLKIILKDDFNTRYTEFKKLREYLYTFDNRDEWVDKTRTALLA